MSYDVGHAMANIRKSGGAVIEITITTRDAKWIGGLGIEAEVLEPAKLNAGMVNQIIRGHLSELIQHIDLEVSKDAEVYQFGKRK